MKKQSTKKHEIVENTVSPVVKSESCDSAQVKNKSAQDVPERCEEKVEISKARNQKKSKRTSRDAEIRETKTSAVKIESTRHSAHNAAKYFMNTRDCKLPQNQMNHVLKRSVRLPLTTPQVRGYDFNNGVDYSAILASYKHSGFQATNFGLAVEEILRMLVARKIPLDKDEEDHLEVDDFIKRRHSCTIFLSCAAANDTLSKGIQQTIRLLAEHRMIDCIITTSRNIEQDLIECLALQARDKSGKTSGKTVEDLSTKITTHFEKWLDPILDRLLEEQKKGVLWTPSKIIARLGEEMNNTNSIYYWAAKNEIPVFSPALTADGKLGNMIYRHSCKNPGLIIDIVSDLKRINTLAIKAITSGIIVIGGGIAKHHVLNANLMRGGADFGVFLNTISEHDGSHSGARPDEAISWGKIRKDSKAVKIYAEASLVFPLLVAETFMRHFKSHKMRIVTSV